MKKQKYVVRRSEYLDVIKGCAIILVVLGHCIQFGSGRLFFVNQMCFSDPVFSFIYGFHMPLFMVVSGFLFWGSVNRHSNWEVIVSRVKSLLIPIFVWQTFYLLLLYLTGRIDFSLRLVYSYSDSLWFLSSVIICSMITLAGRVWFSDSLWFVLTIWGLLLLVSDRYLNGLHVFMFPYFMMGYHWNRLRMQERYRGFSFRKKCGVGIAAFISFTLFYLLYDSPEKSVYLNGTCLLGRVSAVHQLVIDMARYIYGFVGVVIVMILVELLMSRLQRWGVVYVLTSLGKMSLGIYIINHYTYELMLPLPISSNCYYILTVVETIISLWVIYLIIKLIERNRIIKPLLLGK